MSKSNFLKSKLLAGLMILALCSSYFPVLPVSAAVAEKSRLLVTTDIGGDPDDQQGMVRLMCYSNEFDIEGLIASSRMGHGNDVKPDLIQEVVGAYGKVRDNLLLHKNGYPTADYLQSVIKGGQPIAGKFGQGYDTDGSNLIISCVDKVDARPLNISIWGGAADLAQALYVVKTTRTSAQLDEFISKIRVYASYDQDGAGQWINDNFPQLSYILSSDGNVGSTKIGQSAIVRGMYQNDVRKDNNAAYRQLMPTDQLSLTSALWLDTNVKGHGALSDEYPIRATSFYTSGVYQGPATSDGKTWPHNSMTEGLKEGDATTWMYFLNNGLNVPEKVEYGGWGGRYQQLDISKKLYTGNRDKHWSTYTDYALETAWTVARWRQEYQNDFAARMDWCIKPYAEANHNPIAVVNGASTRTVKAGDTISLDASQSSDPDGNQLSYEWMNYKEAGTYGSDLTINNSTNDKASFIAPDVASPKTIHVILKVKDNGAPALTSYQRVIVTVEPNSSANTNGLMGCWKLDETSGTTAADSSGLSHNGTLSNGPAWDTGKVNGCLNFDGTDDYVNVGNPTDLQITGAMTLSSWVYIDSVTNSGRIITKQGNSGARGWSLNVESGGYAAFQVAPSATTLAIVSSDTLPTNQWVHLTGVYDPGVSMKIYVNGVLNNTNTTSIPNAQYNSSQNVNIGRRPSAANYFDGKIDEVKVFNTALNTSEIADLAGVSGGNPSNLISDLIVNDSTNAADWSIRTNIQAGDNQFGDKPYTFTTIPASVAGCDWIRTANDSNAYTGASLATFKVVSDSDVYVAYADGIIVKPTWLSGWIDTGEDITNNENTPATFHLYKRFYKAGSIVSLGSNGDTINSLYTVIVKPLSVGLPVVAEGQYEVYSLMAQTGIPSYQSGDTASVSYRVFNNGSVEKNIVLVFAQYNSNQQLLGIKLDNEDIEAGQYKDFTVNAPIVTGAVKAKCFIWNGVTTMMPIINDQGSVVQ